MRTTVIDVRGKDRLALMTRKDFIYTGRSFWGWPTSIWGNPFKVGTIVDGKPIDAHQAVGMFYQHLRDSDLIKGGGYPLQPDGPLRWSHLRARLPELRGKVLGCFCADWDGTSVLDTPCHAVLLARLCNALDPEPVSQPS